MKKQLSLLICAALILTACNALGINSPIGQPPAPVATNTPAPTVPPPPTPTEFPTPVPTPVPPTNTPAPTFALPTAARGGTNVPATSAAITSTNTNTLTGIRYDNTWVSIKATTFDITNDVKSNLLTITPRTFAEWLQAGQGGLVYRNGISGNFKITALIKTRKRTADAPLTNKTHLAGLMVRRTTPPESYVQISVGMGANAFAVEANNTVSGASKIESTTWPNGDAELRICRLEQSFTLYRRAPNATTWTLTATYPRTDLGGEVQVGATVSTAATPDLKATFENLRIETIKDKAECEK